MREARNKTRRTGRPKKPTSSASAITNAVIQIANSTPGYQVWRQNNVATYDQQAGTYRSFVGRKGVPDVIGFGSEGEWVAIEVKAGRDKLSPEQKEFLMAIHQRGGIAIVARSADQFFLDWKYCAGLLKPGERAIYDCWTKNEELRMRSGLHVRILSAEDKPIDREYLIEFADQARFWVKSGELKPLDWKIEPNKT